MRHIKIMVQFDVVDSDDPAVGCAQTSTKFVGLGNPEETFAAVHAAFLDSFSQLRPEVEALIEGRAITGWHDRTSRIRLDGEDGHP